MPGIVESTQPGSESDKQQNPSKQVARNQLVHRLMSRAADLPAFLHDLIAQQATVVAGTEAACFLLEAAPQAPQAETAAQAGPNFNLRAVAHLRNDSSSQEVRQAALEAFGGIARRAVNEGKDAVIEIEGSSDGSEPQFCLVTLLRADTHVVAVSAVITRCRDVQRAQQRLEMMLLVAGYFEIYSFRRNLEQARAIASQNQTVLQLASTVATAPGFETAAKNLCNELASRTRAARVAIGWVKGDVIKLKAMSHTEEFDKKQELAIQIVKAMEEALDQEELVQYEGEGQGSPNVTREAQALSRMEGGSTVLSLPLRRGEEIVGVMTLEFAPNTKIGPQAATALVVATEILAPQLFDRYQNDRWLITKVGLSIKELGENTLSPKYMLSKLIVGLCIIVLLVSIIWTPMFKVTAPFKFVADQQQQITAPFDGQLAKVYHLPGDHVKAGELLLEFKTYDLEDQLAKANSELAQAIGEENAARSAAGDMRTDEANRAAAAGQLKQAVEKQNEANAYIRLYTRQIEAAKIKAPFDGDVLQGDQRDRVDSQFKTGDQLMAFADLGKLKVQLDVAERDIQWIKDDGTQVGQIATTAMPDMKYPIRIERIDPLGSAQGGQNVFEVKATLEKMTPTWLPGQAGEARVEIEKRSLLWIWTHRVVEFLKLKLWM